MKIPEGYRQFTPYRYPGSNLREEMLISSEDMEKWDSLPPGLTNKTVKVTDLLTNKTYTVRRADCGLDCICAAEIIDF